MAAVPRSPSRAREGPSQITFVPGNSISQITHPGARELDLPNHASIHGSRDGSAVNRPQITRGRKLTLPIQQPRPAPPAVPGNSASQITLPSMTA
uniref:Uncharacterized protein n=1 Tax=Zea mays TaxID=4577 RepID=A0A804N2F7_MAIZE